MAEYARFYKSDLHMHSPLDKSWRDRATKICDADTDERKAEVADLYLRRCHAVELDVIAVVDHNFGRSPEAPFLNWLRLRNRPVADELGKEPLIIFPGFEIECRVGRGGHIVCLFAHEQHLSLAGMYSNWRTGLRMAHERGYSRGNCIRLRHFPAPIPERSSIAKAHLHTGVTRICSSRGGEGAVE
jgi:predicted metal-dependent phosphoesterase TrpH